MSAFLPAKQMLAETNAIKNRQREQVSAALAIAMDNAKKEEKTEVNFYDLKDVKNTTIELIMDELRVLGYQVVYTPGQREGRYLTVSWGNA